MEVHRNDMSEPPREEKTRFRRWMEALNCICNTNYARIAGHIGVTRSALSQSIRKEGGIKPETALAIMKKYQLLAEQQNIPLPLTWEKFFLLSWFKGSEVINQADETLHHIEFMADIIRERDILRKQVEALKSQSLGQDLLAALRENERLKGELERLVEKGNS